jgi:dipeptidyl-peptidase-3
MIVWTQVQLGLHELLGHGSGKLFKEEEKGLNFDRDLTLNPLTQQKVDKWYKRGQTFETVFTSLMWPFEECRAECVGLYLSLEPNVLK